MSFFDVPSQSDVNPDYVPIAEAMAFLPKSRRDPAAAFVRNIIASGRGSPIRHHRVAGGPQLFVDATDAREAVAHMVPKAKALPASDGVEFTPLAKILKRRVPKRWRNAAQVYARSLVKRGKVRSMKIGRSVFVHPSDVDTIVGRYNRPANDSSLVEILGIVNAKIDALEEARATFVRLASSLQSHA